MSDSPAIEQQIPAKPQSIGVATVLRALPTVKKRTVGPFVFLDHMEPEPSGKPRALDVPPHPHIGLATVTYLFEGAIHHKDSIGSSQLIEPGAVNWMTAGRGIVHSERTPEHRRDAPPDNYGVQCWVALPLGAEEVEPKFQHVPASELPVLGSPSSEVRLIAGTGFGFESPVDVASPLLCAAIRMSSGGRVTIPADHEERALFLLDGDVRLDGTRLKEKSLYVIARASVPVLAAAGNVRGFLFGGPPLPERRFLDWNFCSTSRERIEEAKQKYREGRLGALPEEGRNLPLPEDSR